MTTDNGSNSDAAAAGEEAGRALRSYGGATAASSEAVASQLPGRRNGPADAYRHLLWSAEMTRRFGEDDARTYLGLHKLQNWADGQSPDERAMDNYNNEIGISIGKRAKTWDDVKAEAQRVMDRSDRDGSGGNNDGAVWLPESEWRKNPRDANGNEFPTAETNWPKIDWKRRVPEPYVYPYGGPPNPLDVPVETWSQADVEDVMASAAYRND